MSTVKLKRSAVQGKVPTTTDLELGELAINTYDGKLYLKKDDGTASIVDVTATSGINNIVEDLTPQLGGNLDTNGNDILFGDNDKAIFGAGSDLQIYHNGSASFIVDSGTGNLKILGQNIEIGDPSGVKTFQGISGAQAQLFYNNAEKLATTATGVDVTGTVTTNEISVSDTNNADPVRISRTSPTTNQVGMSFNVDGVHERWFGVGTDTNPYWSTSADLTNGNEMWHAGNDGTGSGLDADLLDGQEGTYYLNAANFTGTLPNDFVTLGTMTTGNYVATIAGTTNEIEVSGSGSETAAVTIGLPNDVTVTNNLTVGNNVILDEYILNSQTATLTTVTQSQIASFTHATYGSAEIIIQAKDGSNIHLTKLLVTHNGTTASSTEYGTIWTNASLATYDVDISGANVRILATSASTNSTVYKVALTLMKA